MKKDLKVCGYCLLFVLAEIGAYLSYRHHDARFHWFLHFFVGASAALLIMTVVAWKTRRPASYPLLWILVGHLISMFPDVLFGLFSWLHESWMDVFLFHISAHFMPGRNLTWYVIFMTSLAIYLRTLSRMNKLEEV